MPPSIPPKTVKESDSPGDYEIPITVHFNAHEKRVFFCRSQQPLAAIFGPLEALIGHRCLLVYNNPRGVQMLDRTKTPLFYGMTYDEDVYLATVTRLPPADGL